MKLGLAAWVATLALGLPACTKKPAAEPAATAPSAAGPAVAPATETAATATPSPATSAPPAEKSPEELANKGKAVYLAYCSACHNSNPKQAGTLGPDVHGSSLALLEARLLKAEYPLGYEPKRKSKAMVAMPQVKADLPALHAYLNLP